MNIIYAIYKENIIPLIGGINPENIETGLGEYNGWKLCAMEEKDFNKFSEFKFYPISKEIAVGISLIGKDEAEENDNEADMIDDDEPEEAKAQLEASDEEIKLINASKKFIEKLDQKFIARTKIREYKDFEDDLRDTKLLIEFLIGYIAEDYESKSDQDKENFPMKEIMNGLIEFIDQKDLRINKEDERKKIVEILKDEEMISRIVKSHYLDKIQK